MSTILETRDVSCVFTVGNSFFAAKRPLHAVNGVSIKVEKGSVLGLVGESGCGKSVTARSILGIVEHPGFDDWIQSVVAGLPPA